MPIPDIKNIFLVFELIS